MILSIHAITGAILGSNSNSLGQAILLGIVSHYFLDSIPHVEYKIENIEKGNLKIAFKEFTKIFIDLMIGLTMVLYLIQNKDPYQSILILVGALVSLIPDVLYFLDCIVVNKNKNILTRFLKNHSFFHRKTHSIISKKIITIPSQIAIILFLIYMIFR